jgi:carboxyl-terminal processing protease
VNLATPAPAADADRTKFNLSVYDNVWRWIDTRYYDANFNGADWPAARERHRAAAAAAKNDAELYTAINAMLDELRDRHTHAQPADEFARSFRHLNIVLGWRSRELPGATDGRRVIIEVFPGSAAADAGVRVGWTLVACDGRPPLEVVGPGKVAEGQAVRCDFLTETGEAKTLTIAGRRMIVPTYRAVREVAPEIFLLRFDGFDMPSAHWVREQVRAHASAKALIFDLRGNPGGHVFALASILGDVFPQPVDLGELVHRGHVAWWHHFLLQRGGPRYAGKIAVLVSGGTTSAAEIFSQLVQENGRGIIVGQKTGAALLTSVFWPLAGGGKLWLSVYDYRSPKGSRVEGRGVSPDIVVPVPETPTADENDPVVRAAIEALSSVGGSPAGKR